MKKDLFKKVVAGALLTGTLGVTACNSTPARITDFEVIKGNTEFNVNDTFSVAGFKLKLKMSDGSEKTIDITNDMITAAPDMTSSGSKDVKISYDGNEYTFSIVVKGYNSQEMLNKLQEFKENYNGVKSTSNVKVNMSYNFDSRVFDQEANVSDVSPSMEFKKGDIGSDKMLNHIFTSLHNSITNAGLNSTLNDIVDANNLKAKLNLTRTLNNLSTSLVNFDYLRYLIYDSLLIPADEYGSSYTTIYENLKTMLVDMLSINENGKNVFGYWLKDNINTLIGGNGLDNIEALEELNDIVQHYSKDDATKALVYSLYTEANTLGGHFMSTFIKRVATSVDIHLYIKDKLGEYLVTNTQTSNYSKNIVAQVGIIVEQLENIVADVQVGNTDNLNEYLENATNAYEEIEYILAVMDSNGYELHFSEYTYFDLPYELCDRIVNKRLSNSVVTDMISYNIANMLEMGENEEALEAVNNWLNGYIDLMVNDFESVDPMQILTDLKVIVEEYSAENSLILLFNSAYDTVSNLNQNILSTFIKAYATNNEYFSLVYEKDTTWYEEMLGAVVTNEQTIDLTQQVITEIGNIVEQLENIAFDSANTATYMANISTACSNIVDMEENGVKSVMETLNENNWVFGLDLSLFDMIKAIADRYNDNLHTMFVTIVEDFGLVDMILTSSGISEVISEEAYTQLGNLLLDIVKLNPNYEENAETYIRTLCAEIGIEDENVVAGFVSEFNQHKTLSIASYILEQQWEAMQNDPENADFIEGNPLPECIELVKVIEQLPVSFENYDGSQTHPIQNVVEKAYDFLVAYTDFIGNAGVGINMTTLVSLLNPANDLLTNINTVIDNNKYEIIDSLTMAGASFLQLEFESDGYEEFGYWVNSFVNNYLDEELDIEASAKELLNIINTYCNEDIKITANAMAMNILLLTTDLKDIDFNEIFKDIELPEVIESVDFNKLFEKLTSKDTYVNLIKLKDLEIKYVTNNQNEIVKQILSVTIAVDMDVEVIATHGEYSINIEMDL